MFRVVRASIVAGLLTTLGLGAIVALRAAAPETEVREFTIEVGGDPAGKYTMTVTKQDNGILSMQGQANIKVTYLFGIRTYTYSYSGVEHWKDGRLLQLTSQCNDDGKKTEVSAAAQNDSLLVKVNGHAPRTCRGEVWTTTYWMQAAERFHNNQVLLLDADTGTEYVGQLKFVGKENLGQQQNCSHFRVTGGPTTPCDLWFDTQQRLVRQEFTDQGKRVVFALAAVRR